MWARRKYTCPSIWGLALSAHHTSAGHHRALSRAPLLCCSLPRALHAHRLRSSSHPLLPPPPIRTALPASVSAPALQIGPSVPCLLYIWLTHSVVAFCLPRTLDELSVTQSSGFQEPVRRRWPPERGSHVGGSIAVNVSRVCRGRVQLDELLKVYQQEETGDE